MENQPPTSSPADQNAAAPTPIVNADGSMEIGPVKISPPRVDATMRLRVLTCEHCGVPFAMPLTMFLAKTHLGSLAYCPGGHSQKLRRESLAKADLLFAAQYLADELTQRTYELQAACFEIARLKIASPPAVTAPAAPVEGKELLRRINLEISRALIRASHSFKSRSPVCTRCGKLFANRRSFKNHLERFHAADIAAMPATAYAD